MSDCISIRVATHRGDESLLLRLTQRRVLKAQERVWIPETDEPRFALLNDEAGKVLNASVIGAACLGIESEVIQTSPQPGWIAEWAIKGCSLERIIQDPNAKVHSKIH